MSLLELGGNKFTIPVGEVVLGSDAGCAIPLSGAGVLPRHAVLQGQADGQVIIRKASPAADVLINGDRKSTRLNSSHGSISYAVFCLKKKKLNLSSPPNSDENSTQRASSRDCAPHIPL